MNAPVQHARIGGKCVLGNVLARTRLVNARGVADFTHHASDATHENFIGDDEGLILDSIQEALSTQVRK